MSPLRPVRSTMAACAVLLSLAACGSGGGDPGGAAAGGGGGGGAPAGGGGGSSGGGGAGGGATTDQIEVKDFAYKPEDATVKVGTKVTWNFKDSAAHNVEAVDGGELTKSPDLKTGGTYSFTFTKPGVVKYRCSIHNYMTGTVTVTA